MLKTFGTYILCAAFIALGSSDARASVDDILKELGDVQVVELLTTPEYTPKKAKEQSSEMMKVMLMSTALHVRYAKDLKEKGEEHIDTLTSNYYVAKFMLKAKLLPKDDIVETFERGLKVSERLDKEKARKLGKNLLKGANSSEEGLYSVGKSPLRAIYKQHKKAPHFSNVTLNYLIGLRDAYVFNGQIKNAVNVQERLDKHFQSTYYPKGVQAYSRVKLAILLAQIGDEKAISHFEESLKLYQSDPASNGEAIRRTLLHAANYSAMFKKYKKAEKYLLMLSDYAPKSLPGEMGFDYMAGMHVARIAQHKSGVFDPEVYVQRVKNGHVPQLLKSVNAEKVPKSKMGGWVFVENIVNDKGEVIQVREYSRSVGLSDDHVKAALAAANKYEYAQMDLSSKKNKYVMAMALVPIL